MEWCRNREAGIKKDKVDLIQELDALDILAEQQSLTGEESNRRREIAQKIDKI
jgi:hypothetical protein